MILALARVCSCAAPASASCRALHRVKR